MRAHINLELARKWLADHQINLKENDVIEYIFQVFDFNLSEGLEMNEFINFAVFMDELKRAYQQHTTMKAENISK